MVKIKRVGKEGFMVSIGVTTKELASTDPSITDILGNVMGKIRQSIAREQQIAQAPAMKAEAEKMLAEGHMTIEEENEA